MVIFINTRFICKKSQYNRTSLKFLSALNMLQQYTQCRQTSNKAIRTEGTHAFILPMSHINIRQVREYIELTFFQAARLQIVTFTHTIIICIVHTIHKAKHTANVFNSASI